MGPWNPQPITALVQLNFCYTNTRLNSQNPPLSQSSCFPETTEVTNTVQPKQNRFDFSYFLSNLLIAPSKGIQYSLGFWIPRRVSGFQALDSGFFVSRIQNADSRYWIPDFLSCIPGFRAHESGRFPDSGFNEQKFAGFRCLDSLIWGDTAQKCCHQPLYRKYMYC